MSVASSISHEIYSFIGRVEKGNLFVIRNLYECFFCQEFKSQLPYELPTLL